MDVLDTPYVNPTIQEAVFEIGFRIPEFTAWQLSWFQDFSAAISERFPVWQPTPNATLQMRVSGVNPLPTGVATHMMRYATSDGKQLIHLSDRALSINHLVAYPGWKIFSETIEFTWNALKTVFQPLDVTQLGMRYINKIERTKPDQKLSEWFRPNDFMSKSILNSSSGLLSICQVRPDKDNSLSVTVGEVLGGAIPSIVLDIDRTSSGPFSADTETLIQKADEIHLSARQVFEAAKGEKLASLLAGELVS